MMNRRLGLSLKLIASVLILSVLLCAVISYMGYREFTTVLEEEYNRSAYEIAETARTYINPDKLLHYLETGEKDDEFNEIERLLDSLVVSTDSYIIYVTTLSDDYMTSTYIFDSVHPDTGFTRYELGYTSRDMDPAYSDEIEMMMTTGERSAVYFYSYSEASGAHTTAAIPVSDSSGEIIAMIGVEKAMTALDTARMDYVVRVLEVTIIAVAAFLVIYIAYLRRNVIKPILSIAGEAERFAEDNVERVDVLAGIKNKDEIGVLADVIAKMESDISSYIANITAITAEKERISAELDVARTIQASMLPSIFPPFPDNPHFDIYATMTPAREVGGDFYDFFLIDDRHIALVMADVSGKGIPAALFMVISRTLIKSRSQQGDKPDRILTSVNEQLCENNEAGMFVTVWLGIYDTATCQLEYANAGHDYPAIRRKDGSFELLKNKPNFVLAGMEGAKYTLHSTTLFPGDRLFLYTDGVPEAANSSFELFGMDRMMDALDNASSLPPHDFLLSIKHSVDQFVDGAEANDDITMLVFDVKERTNAKSIKLPCDIKSLPEGISFAEESLRDDGAPDATIERFMVAIDELFSNVAFYSGASSITMEYEGSSTSQSIRIIDDGKAYDPTESEAPDITLSAEERGIGGLGIHIVKKLMDAMSYERRDGLNVVRVSINRAPKEEP